MANLIAIEKCTAELMMIKQTFSLVLRGWPNTDIGVLKRALTDLHQAAEDIVQSSMHSEFNKISNILLRGVGEISEEKFKSTFDGWPLRCLAERKFGKKSARAKLNAFRHMSGDVINWYK